MQLLFSFRRRSVWGRGGKKQEESRAYINIEMTRSRRCRILPTSCFIDVVYWCTLYGELWFLSRMCTVYWWAGTPSLRPCLFRCNLADKEKHHRQTVRAFRRRLPAQNDLLTNKHAQTEYRNAIKLSAAVEIWRRHTHTQTDRHGRRGIIEWKLPSPSERDCSASIGCGLRMIL